LQSLRREIDRRIELIPRVVNEAKLLREEQDNGQPKIVPGTQLISTYYRLRAVDDIKILGKNHKIAFLKINLSTEIIYLKSYFFRKRTWHN